MTFLPRTLDEILGTAQATYEAEDGDPLRVTQGGDLYPFVRAVGLVVADSDTRIYNVQQDSFLDDVVDIEVARKHITPYGLDIDPGRASSGGIVAVPLTGAKPKVLPSGALFAVNNRLYMATAAVTLGTPWKIIPVTCTQVGTGGDAKAGLAAALIQGELFSDYTFYVGTNGVGVNGKPYGDIIGGLGEETIYSYKQRFYRMFNNPGYGLVRVLQATALNVSREITEAVVLRKTPAPGYVTIYIDNGQPVVPLSLLQLVETKLYEKASAGEYLIVRALAHTLLDIEVDAYTDGTVAPLTAEADITSTISRYMQGLPAGAGLFKLRMDEQLARLGHTYVATYWMRDAAGVRVPFEDRSGEAGKTIRPGSITTRIVGVTKP